MEFDVRDWMIIVGVLLIVAVLLDGYRRMRNERRGNIRMSLNKQFLNAATAEENSSELPNGGRRVVGRSDLELLHRGMSDDHPPDMSDGDIDLERSVPMLMDSVAANREVSQAQHEIGLTDAEVSPAQEQDEGYEQSFDKQQGDDVYSAADTEQESEREQLDPLFDDVYAAKQTAVTNSTAAKAKPAAHVDNEEVVVIHVLAKKDPFKGPDLLHILLACDLRFGEMNIFHRYERANGVGEVQFSMANSVVPGTFDLDDIEDFTTPAVSFFMTVPGPEDSIKAFECMVETAQCLVANLDGELRDESRSAMTNQTLEHYRQRLQEFERRQLTRQL